MPTVLRADGFQVRIRLPPREHGPAHVHVRKSGTAVIINLPDGDQPLTIRRVRGMSAADVVAAFRLVDVNVELLLKEWRRYHG